MSSQGSPWRRERVLGLSRPRRVIPAPEAAIGPLAASLGGESAEKARLSLGFDL